MIVKLCWKEYDAKINLGACKLFYDKTGKDLTSILLSYLDVCRKTRNMDLVDRLMALFEIETADTISKMFYCLFKEGSGSIPIEEIQDAMHRVSWMPTDEDGDMCEPWPFVVVELATQVNDYYSQLNKKKAGT